MSNEANSILVTTFYRFFSIQKEHLQEIRDQIELKGNSLHLKGLFLIGTEGINSTLSGEKNDVVYFKSFIKEILNQPDIIFKDSWAKKRPFKRWKVKIRKEIVTIGQPGLVPASEKNNHLSPSEWDYVLKNEDVAVFDTRNFYETEIGKFKQAIDPKIDNFQEFTQYVKESGVKKDKKILIYCTGGIRCEKAILDLSHEGYNNVFQLEGGILNYIKEFPEGEFEGECFVFDHRVSVDQNLEPSKKYSLCPHCGNPAEVKMNCIQCGLDSVVCQSCLNHKEEKPWVETCSKNCAHHFRLGHKTRRVHKESLRQ